MYKAYIKNQVNFPRPININTLNDDTRKELINAGRSIQSTLKINFEYPEIQYLLIIEGQASKDNYTQNYELSYERALALWKLWNADSIDFGSNCEV